jgi:hypothetical protein
MLPIPSELKGREAKSFIDEINKLLNSVCDNMTPFINTLYNFYSQPFSPDMIAEYFEGWELNSDTDYSTYDAPLYESQLHIIDFTGNTINIMDKSHPLGKSLFIAPIPSTLDQFISNLFQAAITLKFKE